MFCELHSGYGFICRLGRKNDSCDWQRRLPMRRSAEIVETGILEVVHRLFLRKAKLIALQVQSSI